MLIIFVFCIGVIIGLSIDTRLNDKTIKAYRKEIERMEKFSESQSEMIDVYTVCYKELEKAYNNCHDGILETINENIELKRRLDNGN